MVSLDMELAYISWLRFFMLQAALGGQVEPPALLYAILLESNAYGSIHRTVACAQFLHCQ